MHSAGGQAGIFSVVWNTNPNRGGSAMKFGKVGSTGMCYFYTLTYPCKAIFGPKTYEVKIVVGNKKRTH
jgi:hypothetical protein